MTPVPTPLPQPAPAHPDFAHERHAVLVRLAQVLDLADAGRVQLPPQAYRDVSRQLSSALQRHSLPPDAFDAFLKAHPSASALYENLQFHVAGLARSPLDAAVAAERETRSFLGRLGRA
ncbi:MAG: hypothetical protein ACOVQT_12210 [Rubrivivax sp.]